MSRMASLQGWRNEGFRPQRANRVSGDTAQRRRKNDELEERDFPEAAHMIRTIEVTVATKGHCDVHDLTASLSEAIQRSGLREGQVLVFVPGATAGVTTVEFEPGLIRDLHEFFEAILPERRNYHHHATWGDDNGASHLRAALLKPALPIPFRDGTPLLGTWQQLVLVDFDTRPRRRRVIFQLTGES